MQRSLIHYPSISQPNLQKMLKVSFYHLVALTLKKQEKSFLKDLYLKYLKKIMQLRVNPLMMKQISLDSFNLTLEMNS